MLRVDFFFDLNSEQKLEWSEFWQDCGHSHPRQHILFADIEKAQGKMAVYAAGRVDGRIKCIGVFSIKPTFFERKFSLEAVCLRGPAFDNIEYAKEFLAQSMNYFKSLKVGRIRISPYWQYPEAQAVEQGLMQLGFRGLDCYSGTRSFTGTVDLRQSDEEMFASLKSKTRQEIRRTEKLGVSIRPAVNRDDANLFFQTLSSLHHQRSLDAISSREFDATFENVLKDQQLGILLNAFNNGDFIGGLWVIRGPKTCHYARFVVVRDALKKLKNLTIGPALWWRGIRWAKEIGCSELDVEGYQDDVPRHHPKYSLLKLKSRFNPEPVEILGQYQYVCNRATYAVYKGYRFSQRGLGFVRAMPYRLKTSWVSFKGNKKTKGQSTQKV